MINLQIQSLEVKMFTINKITSTMSHEQKVYEYARRISHYSQEASSERAKSKVFACENTARNKALFNEECGCFKHYANDSHEPCDPCKAANQHYLKFRDAKSKQGAAMRQLNKEMNKCK